MLLADRVGRRITSIRNNLGEFWWYAALLFGVQMAGALINFYTGLWLIPRFVPQADLGAILPLTQVAAFLAFPLSLILTPVGKYLNTFVARGEIGKAKALLIDACRISVVVAVVMAAYTITIAPFVKVRLHVSGAGVVAMLCGLAFMSGIKPVIGNATQALKRFDNMIVGNAVIPPLRFGLIWLLAGSFGLTGYLGSQLALECVMLLIGGYALHGVLGPHVVRRSYRSHWREMWSFSIPLIASGVISAFNGAIEPFVIRHRLPEMESAAYYYVTRFAEIAGCMSGTVSVLLFPLVSERFEKGQSTRHLLWHANISSLVVGGLVVVGLGVGGTWLMRLKEQWEAYAQYATFIWPLGLIQVLNIPLSTFITYETACRRFTFIWLSSFVLLVKTVFLYSITGWSFFEPYMPSAWWEAVNRIDACRLGFVIVTALVTQIVLLAIIVVLLMVRLNKKHGEHRGIGPTFSKASGNAT